MSSGFLCYAVALLPSYTTIEGKIVENNKKEMRFKLQHFTEKDHTVLPLDKVSLEDKRMKRGFWSRQTTKPDLDLISDTSNSYFVDKTTKSGTKDSEEGYSTSINMKPTSFFLPKKQMGISTDAENVMKKGIELISGVHTERYNAGYKNYDHINRYQLNPCQYNRRAFYSMNTNPTACSLYCYHPPHGNCMLGNNFKDIRIVQEKSKVEPPYPLISPPKTASNWYQTKISPYNFYPKYRTMSHPVNSHIDPSDFKRYKPRPSFIYNHCRNNHYLNNYIKPIINENDHFNYPDSNYLGQPVRIFIPMQIFDNQLPITEGERVGLNNYDFPKRLNNGLHHLGKFLSNKNYEHIRPFSIQMLNDFLKCVQEIETEWSGYR